MLEARPLHHIFHPWHIDWRGYVQKANFIGNFILSDKRGQLSIAAEHYPSYEMEKPIHGLRDSDYQVALKAFTPLGYLIEVEFLSWKRVIQYPKLGKTVDILTCAYLKYREEFLVYSDSIREFFSGFYVRNGFNEPQSVLLEYISKGVRINLIHSLFCGIKHYATETNRLKCTIRCCFRALYQ